MDRTAFAACASVLGLALVAGCDAQPSPPPQDHAPLVLAELKAASPGPWRSSSLPPVAPTSLQRPEHLPYAPPEPLGLPNGGDKGLPWQGQPSPLPLQADSAAPAGTSPDPAPLRVADPYGSNVPGATEANERRQPIEPTPVTPNADQSSAAPLPPAATSALPPVPPAPAAERVALPWATPSQPSPQIMALLRRAEAHVQQGIALTERNALYLARAEFLAALQAIAQANDMQQNVQFYSDVLTAGVAALEESSDFVRPRRVGKRVDIARTISGHKTPILKDESPSGLAPVVAAERYYTYAQEQLAAAVARQPAGSRALYGLGKLAAALGSGNPAQQSESAAQAKVYYQAALLADPSNGRAANELAVILARGGELARARELLVHSVRLEPHPSTHRNLAAVSARLGDTSLAQEATRRAVALEQAGQRRSGAVQWLDPATFAATAPATDALLPPAAATPVATQAAASPTVSTAGKSPSNWLPWNPRR